MKRQCITNIENRTEFIVPDQKSYIISKLDQHNKANLITINMLSNKDRLEAVKQTLKKDLPFKNLEYMKIE